MPQPPHWRDDPEQEAMGWDFEGARRFHASQGLKMTPAERFHWLEKTVAEMRKICGLARYAEPVSGRRTEDV